MTTSTDETLAALADAHRALGATGRTDLVWGHIGVRDPDRPGVWMKAAGLDPDVPRYTYTGNLVRDEDTGTRLAETLGDAAGVLMPAHGFVVVGEDLAVAVMRAVLLERACRNQLDALAAGGPVRWSDDDEIARKRALVWSRSQYRAGYDYLLRGATLA